MNIYVWSAQENFANVAAARLISKQLTMKAGYKVSTEHKLLLYGMPDKQYQKESVDIYNTSRVYYMHDVKCEWHSAAQRNKV